MNNYKRNLHACKLCFLRLKLLKNLPFRDGIGWAKTFKPNYIENKESYHDCCLFVYTYNSEIFKITNSGKIISDGAKKWPQSYIYAC